MTGTNWQDYILIILVILLLVWTMTRRRKSGNPRLDATGGILSNVNDNLRILEERMANSQSKKKFQTKNWKTYQDKLEFLEPSTVSSLNQAFTLAEDFNSRIESAMKNRVMGTLQDMPLEKLREPLTKSRDELVAWIRTNYQAEARGSQRSGCSGF